MIQRRVQPEGSSRCLEQVLESYILSRIGRKDTRESGNWRAHDIAGIGEIYYDSTLYGVSS